MPDWSPVRHFGGYQGASRMAVAIAMTSAHVHVHGNGQRCGVHGRGHAAHHPAPSSDYQGFWGALGCSCFAF
jgi:hypothetical protein